MPAANQPEIIRFVRDMTLRWPSRRGDFILWMGYSDIFSGPESIQIYDLWEMRDGYHVTITNRPEDLFCVRPISTPRLAEQACRWTTKFVSEQNPSGTALHFSALTFLTWPRTAF